MNCCFCGKVANLYDPRTRSYFCDPCVRLDNAVHIHVDRKTLLPLCWTCGKPARFYDHNYEHHYCEQCNDARMHEEILRGLRREELIAFETFVCSHCGGKNSRPAFSVDKNSENCLFSGWRMCLDCKKNFIESDQTFFVKARITPFEVSLVGSTEEG
jgi:hypothetical protein